MLVSVWLDDGRHFSLTTMLPKRDRDESFQALAGEISMALERAAKVPA